MIWTDFLFDCLSLPVSHTEPIQTSKLQLICKIDKTFQPLTIFTQSSILDVWLDSETTLPSFIWTLDQPTLDHYKPCKDFIIFNEKTTAGNYISLHDFNVVVYSFSSPQTRISHKRCFVIYLQCLQYCLTMAATENNHCELVSKANENTAVRFEMFHDESFSALKKRRLFISVIIFHWSAMSSYKIVKHKIVDYEHYICYWKLLISLTLDSKYSKFMHLSIAILAVCFGSQLITFSIIQCYFRYNLINSFDFSNTGCQ